MNAKENDLGGLAFRAGLGDGAAKDALRRHLEPHIVRMVRCTLKTGAVTNPVAHRALAEARRIGGITRSPEGDVPEHIVSSVARRVLEGVMATLPATAAPRRWSIDTVPAA
jgi:hypothetical protein